MEPKFSIDECVKLQSSAQKMNVIKIEEDKIKGFIYTCTWITPRGIDRIKKFPEIF